MIRHLQSLSVCPVLFLGTNSMKRKRVEVSFIPHDYVVTEDRLQKKTSPPSARVATLKKTLKLL